jgi:hypothetical protein
MMLLHLLTSCRTGIGRSLLYPEHVSSIVPYQVFQNRRGKLSVDDFQTAAGCKPREKPPIVPFT